MFLLIQLLPAIAVAAAVAAAVSAFAPREKGARASRALAAWALGAGYFAGHIVITGWTPFPPTDTTNWLPYFALAAAAIGSLAFLLNSKAARIAVLGLLCVGTMRLLLAPKFRYGWSAAQGWVWVGCLGCGAVLLALSLEAMGRRSSIAIEPPLLLIIISAGTAGVLMVSGSVLLGDFAAVLSGAVMGSLVFTWRCRIDRDAAASVFSLVFVMLLASGYFFAELPAISAALLAAAPVCGLVPTGISAARCAAAARVSVALAAVSGAMLAAWRASPPWSG